jgi:hypothetical protein
VYNLNVVQIVLALPVLMPAVCPLLESPAATLRQAAAVILFIIASKVFFHKYCYQYLFNVTTNA